MPKLFGVDIAGIVAQSIGPGVLPTVLTKVTPGTRTPGDLTGGTNPTTTDYSARGFLDDYRDFQIDGTIIQRGDRIALLIGDTIASSQVPEPGDKITVEGATYNVVNVKRDPAAATYECQVRG